MPPPDAAGSFTPMTLIFILSAPRAVAGKLAAV